MAAYGGLITAVNCSTPNMPRMDMAVGFDAEAPAPGTHAWR
jgi:hypothetical protein